MARLLTIVALLLTLACRWFEDTRREMYLLADGYRGPVVVVSECRGARPTPQVEGAYFYEIPSSGILLVPEEYWVGSIQPGFFYRGDRGEREPVLYGRIDGEDVRAYLMGTVYWDEEPESAGGEVVRRVGLRFFVGNLDDWEGFEASRGPHWRNVQAAARESCLPPE